MIAQYRHPRWNRCLRRGAVCALRHILPSLLLLCVLAGQADAGAWPKKVRIYRGSTPQVDGILSPGEYDDAVRLDDFSSWTPQFDEGSGARRWARCPWGSM